MALYRYVKQPPKVPITIPVRKIISSSFMVIGIFLLVWVSYPIISFELTSRVKFAEIRSPVPDTYKIASNSKQAELPSETLAHLAESVSVFLPKNTHAPRVLNSATENVQDPDYTKASNWYPNKPQGYADSAGRIYFLTIPKLKIKDAVVKISGDDLNETLIHYGGTGLPGDYGTAVIFGHSILPQFYDPSNYKSIFSLLPTLEEGDELYVKYDGVTYRYVVTAMRITGPDDVTVLEQRYDSSYVRLITCVPPGTYWKRLEVTTRLSPY